MLGTLFVDEKPLSIVRIHLQDGRIIFTTQTAGPLTIPQNSEIRIHDPQGNLVAVAPWTVSKREAKMAASAIGGTVTIEFPMAISEVKGWPRVDGR